MSKPRRDLISFAFASRNENNYFCHPPRYSSDPQIVPSTGKLDERECRVRYYSSPGRSREETNGELCSNSPVTKTEPFDQVWKPVSGAALV